MPGDSLNGITVSIVIDKNLNDWLKNFLDKNDNVEPEKEMLSIENIVNNIISVFTDRGGFDDWWYSLDVEICIEIQDELEEIVESYL